MKKSLFTALMCVLLFSAFCFGVSAEEYSTEYPDIYNSGSPVWLHCEISGMGEYVIVLDPRTDLQSFGFDGPDGYNLINNTGSTIYGRAYNLKSDAAYNARWSSFYKLQLQTGTSSYGSTAYEDYNITKIYGTSLDLVDYHGGRQNDMYKHDMSEQESRVFLCVVVTCILVVSVVAILLKPRALRM